MKRLCAVLLSMLLLSDAFADMVPPSSAHIQVDKAEVYDLACSRRPFTMEYTQATARHFPFMAQKIASSGFHPQTLILGLSSLIVIIPLTIVAAPLDLASGPFRRQCSYKFSLTGHVIEWAGRAVPRKSVGTEARNLQDRGIEKYIPATYFQSRAETVTDSDGMFKLTLDGRTGRSDSLGLQWHVDHRPADQMNLGKNGRTFVLSSLSAGFGAGVYEMQPIVITPKKALLVK